MPNFDEVLAQVAATKRDAVVQATDQKKQALGVNPATLVAGTGNDAGLYSANAQEREMREGATGFMRLSPEERLGYANQSIKANSTLSNTRNTSQQVGDALLGAVTGVGSTVGGLAGLGVGIFNKELGASISNDTNQMVKDLQSLQSQPLQDRREFYGQRAGLRERDNDQRYAEDIAAGADSTTAGIAQFGRGLSDGIANTFEDSAVLGDAVASTAGSFITGGILSKGLKVLGKATIGKALQSIQSTLPGTLAGAERARQIATLGTSAEAAAYPVAVGLQEAAGTHASTVDDVLSSALTQESPLYKEAYSAFLDQGVTPTEATQRAKLVVAGGTAQSAALAQLPVAIAAGLLSRAGERPLTLANGARTAAKEILIDEPREEALQGGLAALNQNAAIQRDIDPNRSLAKGAGEATSSGAALGLLSAGGTKSLGLPRAMGEGVIAGIGKLGEIGAQRKMAASDKASDEAVTQVVTNNAAALSPVLGEAATEVAQVSTLSNEKKAEVTSALEQLSGFFTDTSMNGSDDVKANAAVAAVVGGSANNYEALHNLIKLAGDSKTKTADADAALAVYFDEINNIRQYANHYLGDPEVAAVFGEDHPSRKAVTNFISTFTVLENTAGFKRMLAQVAKQIDATQGGATLGDVATNPEAVTAISNMAQVAPESVDGAQLVAILKHAADGTISLTSAQMTGLKHAKSLLDAALAISPDTAVSRNVLFDVAPPSNMVHALSAFAHVKAVKDLVMQGDIPAAKKQLASMGNFVASQMNKVKALNESYALSLADGKPHGVPYQTLQADGTFGISTEVNKDKASSVMTVHAKSAGSLKHAQTIAREAQTLAELYNSVANNFTELGMKARPISTTLHADLLGSPQVTETKPTPIAEPKTTEQPVAKVDKRKKTPLQDERIAESGAAAVELLDEQGGWAEVGGKLIRDNEDNPVDRTKWIPHADWWNARPVSGGKRLNETKLKAAMDKALRGQPMSKFEKENVQFLLDEVEHINDLLGIDATTADVMASGVLELSDEARSLLPESVEISDELLNQLDEKDAEDVAENRNEEAESTSTKAVQQADQTTGAGTTTVSADRSEPTQNEQKVNPLELMFPDLLAPSVNPFFSAFRPRKIDANGEIAPTHMTEVDGQVLGKTLLDKVLQTVSATAFVDSKKAKEAFNYLLGSKGVFGKLMNHLDSLVQRDLQGYVGDKKHGKIIDRLLNDPDGEHASYVMTSPFARMTALLVPKQGDTLELDPKLAKLGTAAALSYVMTKAMGDEVIMDVEEHLAGFGLDMDSVSRDAAQFLMTGFDRQNVINGIEQNIVQFWGLTADKSAPLGDIYGIPASLALMIYDGLVTAGAIQENHLTIDNKTYLRVTTDPAVLFGSTDLATAAMSFDTAIEDAVVVNPERDFYMDGAEPPVATTRMNNRNLQNTADDLAALASHSKSEFSFNVAMTNIYLALGRNGVVELFGSLLGDEKLYNKNHYDSLKGQVSTLTGAFDVFAAMGNKAAMSEKGFAATTFRFAFNMSSVGRMQMLGGYNPQNSKLIREVLPATWGTIDTTQYEGMAALYTAIGQALGIKIHKQSPERTQADVTKALNQKFKPVLDMLRSAAQSREDYFTQPSGSADILNAGQLRAAFAEAGEKKPTPVMLHALSEWVRLESADEAGKKAFTTSLYVEADGVTNGPTMAQMLLMAGPFTEQWINNIAKGGISFGEASPLWKQIEKDGADLYEAVIQSTRELFPSYIMEFIKDVNPRSSKKNVVAAALDNTVSLLGLLAPGMQLGADRKPITANSTIADLGFISFLRELAKNPLTVTTYGSGVVGIANKVTSTMADKFYEMASVAATNLHEASQMGIKITIAQAWFPDDAQADQKFLQMTQMFNMGVTTQLSKSSKGTSVRGSAAAGIVDFSKPADITLNAHQFNALSANVRFTLIEPMVQAIWGNLGSGTHRGTGMVLDATSMMGQIQEVLFQTTIADFMEQHMISKSDFLSEKQMEQIYALLRKKVPVISTGHQTFMVSKFAAAPLDGMGYSKYTLSSGTEVESSPALRAPVDPGVQGIPMTNIGMGDGRMMQWLAQRYAKDGDHRFLLIFDGAHLPLDRLTEMGKMANEAVVEAISDNPFEHISKAYNQFMKTGFAEFVEMGKNSGMLLPGEPLYLFLLKYAKEVLHLPELEITEEFLVDMAYETIQIKAQTIQAELANVLTQTTANKAALAQTKMSVDQMAATESPITREGEFDITDRDVADKAEFLNKLAAQHEEERVVAESAAKVLSLSPTQVAARMPAMSAAQQTVFDNFFRRYVKDSGYTFIFGSAEELADYRTAQHMPTIKLGKQDKGFIDRNNKIIAVIGEPTAETLLHEMIHAALGTSLENYYADVKVPAHVATAIRELEALMQETLQQQFLQQQESELVPAGNFPLSAINGITDRAAKLHEFVAWSLSNDVLLENQEKQTRSLNKKTLKALAQKVWSKLKQMFGIKNLNTVGDQIKLFAGAVARYNATLSDTGEVSALKHAPNVYTLRQALDEKFHSMFGKDGATVDAIPLDQVKVHAVDVVREVTRAFNIAPQDLPTLQSMVQVFATEAKINTAAFNQMNHLYQQVLGELDGDSFIPATSVDRDADRPASRAKYDILNGRSLHQKDPYGRSSIVPVFLALTLIDPQLQEILKNIQAPKNDKGTGTFDERASVLGNNLMNSLSSKLAGQNKPANMQEAFNELFGVLQDSLHAEASMVDGISNRYSELANTGNDWVVGHLAKLSDKGEALSGWLGTKNGRLASLSSGFIHALSQGLVDNKAKAFSLGTMHMLNNAPKVWKPFYDMVNGMIGRTEENAPVIDMIKSVRTAVQQVRQMYRDDVPKVIRNQFKQALSKEQWAVLNQTLAKTDLAVFMENWTGKRIRQMLSDEAERRAVETDLVSQIGNTEMVTKARQLAQYMVSGERGSFLLTNAAAIVQVIKGKPDAALETTLDKYISVHALGLVSKPTKDAVISLVQSEEAGIDFVLGYLHAMRTNEANKMAGAGKFNQYKGHVPLINKQGAHLFVGDDTQRAEFEKLGYTRVGGYVPSSWDTHEHPRGYYLTNEGLRSPVSQGVLQTVRDTVNGVDTHHGLSLHGSAGLITADKNVEALRKRFLRLPTTKDNGTGMRPIFDEKGTIIAFERGMDHKMLAMQEPSSKLDELLGVWAGRQIEEQMATIANEALLNNLKNIWETQTANGTKNTKEFVNLFGGDLTRVQQDMVDLIPAPIRLKAMEIMPEGKLWVRKDMLEDVMGYRNASIGDVFTGVTDMNELTRKQVEDVLVGVFGIKAAKTLVGYERILQNAVGSVKHNIVVRSVAVPAMNIISNMYQLRSVGVPFHAVIKGMPHKLAEIHQYTKSRLEQIELQTQLDAIKTDATKTAASAKLSARIQAITDGHRRMAIWPLIEAGEFSTVSDVGMTAEDLSLTSGKFDEYIEAKMDKLPAGLRTLAQYGWVARNTALYRGLQKSVQYGDFVAKAILYDHLTMTEGKPKQEAIGMLSEEFVNYDRLPSRRRAYLESIGAIWFFNYKLRIVKSSLRALRNKPLHVLMAMAMPAPTGAGLPITDNLFSKLAEGTLDNSVGPGMLFRGAMLNPWVNLAN